MTGIRKAGEARFHLHIQGYPESDFPPVQLHSTLRELGAWLREADRRMHQPTVLMNGAGAALLTRLS